MSERCKVCVYSEPSTLLHLKPLLSQEEAFDLETIDRDSLLALSHPCSHSHSDALLRAEPTVLVIEAARLSSLDQGDDLAARLGRLSALSLSLPLLLLYEATDLSTLSPLLEDDNLAFDLVPRDGLNAQLFKRAIKQALRRKRGEEAQKISGLLEQMMLSIQDYAILMRDPAGLIVNWNSGAERIMGYSRAEVVGQHWSILLTQDQLNSAPLDEALAIARKQGRFEAESTCIRKDGSSLQVVTTIVPVYNARQELQGYTELVRDVTEERQRQERQGLAINIAKMSSWEWDIRTGLVRWSVGQGATGEQAILSRKEFKRLVYAPDLPRVEAAVAHSLHSGQDLHLEFRLRHNWGALQWKVVKGRVFYDEHGQPLRLAGISMDISEKKQAERELEEAKEAAERANQAKSAFLANMSHEIRTPLNAILGFAELMQNSRLSPEKQRDFIRTITRNGKMLSQLLDDILDLSKVEASKLEVEHIRCSLPDIVSDVLKLIAKQASDKGIYLRLTSSQGLPETFVSDPNRLKQILLNIIGNAVKFTQKGGVHVNVSLRPQGLGYPPHVVFSVMDTGPGIDSQQQQRLFQAFSQADASISRSFGGTGLGLILSRRLAELLGGNVELVYSKPGFGSTFRIAIEAPDARGSCQLLSETERDGPASTAGSLGLSLDNDRLLEGISVLIVEDAPDSRALAAQILGQYGARIEMAENGREAVEVLQTREFDVVLMDLQMPQLDGFAATAALRAKGYRLPILAVSAAAMKDEKDRALEVGCNDHLTKPFSIGILVDKILGYARHAVEERCLAATSASSVPVPVSVPVSRPPVAGKGCAFAQ